MAPCVPTLPYGVQDGPSFVNVDPATSIPVPPTHGTTASGNQGTHTVEQVIMYFSHNIKPYRAVGGGDAAEEASRAQSG